MAKTMLDEIATNKALHDAARGGKRMGDVSANQALMSAMMIECQKVNADGSYAGSSYGSFIGSEEKSALDAAFMLQEGSVPKGTTGEDVQNAGRSYSYAGGSYGDFIDPCAQQSEQAMKVAEILDGEVVTKQQEEPAQKKVTVKSKLSEFLRKYKLWVIAAVCAALYFVLRKK